MLQPARPIPIRVNNVPDVDVGYAPRLGAVSMNHRKEVVEGIVLMRKYGNTLDTLAGAKAKIASLNASNIMPRGYRLVPFYDRTKLVETTLHTVFENLTIGMVLVFLVLVFSLEIFAAPWLPLSTSRWRFWAPSRGSGRRTVGMRPNQKKVCHKQTQDRD